MTKPVSGADAGAQNVQRLADYLDASARDGRPLPERLGRVNISAIALACGFDRQVLYKNPAAKTLLDEAVVRLGLEKGNPATGEDDKPKPTNDPRDRRIHKLEQENVALRAEVAGLRERVRRLAHVESHMVDTGRRVSSLQPSLGGIG